MLPVRQDLPGRSERTFAVSFDTFRPSILKWPKGMPMILVATRPEVVMDIRNVSNNGNVERTGSDRGKRAEGKRTDAAPSVVRDEASISTTGRETAAAVEALAERARNSDGDRDAVVTAALRKLMNGELDDAEAVQGAARRLLDGRFSSL
jgi:hypothetical protein